MISWWTLLLLSLGYVAVLFAIAHWGDEVPHRRFSPLTRSLIYSMTLAVYCTSWTFYGAVGSAAQDGWIFLPIYLGPMLVFLLGWPMIRRIVAISKRQNLTSIADFIAARYGKAQSLAVLVTLIATVGSVPYIALQLKAIVNGFSIVSDYSVSGAAQYDTALVVSITLAVFAILFGTRKLDVTEHHEGMMLAIAFESVVKLVAFVLVGLFALLLVFGGANDVAAAGNERADAMFALDRWPDTFVTQLILASAAIFCLPRQFHVAVVEAHTGDNISPARWLFPLYLLVFCIFIPPIAYAGLTLLPPGAYNGDAFVLALPVQSGSHLLTILAFLGGFSAATGMVIVACVALSTMISNEIVMPALLRFRSLGLADRGDYSHLLINVRRGAIVGVALLAYAHYLATDQSAALASIGLLSFAAAAQFAPLIIFGMYWRRATRLGAIAGLGSGFVLWAYTLFLPTLARSGAFDATFVTDGPFGIGWLRPEALIFDVQANPLTHGVAWSLLVNVGVLTVVSLLTRQSMVEKIQSRAFTGGLVSGPRVQSILFGPDISNADLRSLAERFLGERHVARAFAEFADTEDIDTGPTQPADRRLVQFTERLLSGAIGAASARVVMTAALRKSGMEIGDVVVLLDETSEAIRFNRQLLEATLDNISHGVSVVDGAQQLIGWNSRYLELMDYPPGFVYVGRPIEELLRYNAARGRFGSGDFDFEVDKRLKHIRDGSPYRYESSFSDHKVIEIRGQPMPGGGYVTTYSDITDLKSAEKELIEAKASLEQRVADRTTRLQDAMLALQQAKAQAEEANASRTRFLAAAAHDLLQPLNAAKLFAALLNEHRDNMAPEQAQLVDRVGSGLLAVEDLLSAILDISRLDTAAPVPKPQVFPISDLFTALQDQFSQTFIDERIELRFVPTRLFVHSDPALLRRILQNFISNARRYTSSGCVLVGCRRRNGAVAIQVVDTGVGISEEDQKIVFEEFRRLNGRGKQKRRGLGLGLAIVERIARLLDHPVGLRSQPGKGSCFEVVVPRAAPVRQGSIAAAAMARHAGASLGGQCILCIDNDADVLDGMQGLLTKWGAQVCSAANEAEAIAELIRLRTSRLGLPALLLVDYHLDDGVTGLEVIEALRDESGRDIPALILTADHSADVADRVRESGHALLRKPVKPAALRALINRLLARRDVA